MPPSVFLRRAMSSLVLHPTLSSSLSSVTDRKIVLSHKASLSFMPPLPLIFLIPFTEISQICFVSFWQLYYTQKLLLLRFFTTSYQRKFLSHMDHAFLNSYCKALCNILTHKTTLMAILIFFISQVLLLVFKR